VRCGEADDPIEEERNGGECAGDFEGGLHRGDEGTIVRPTRTPVAVYPDGMLPLIGSILQVIVGLGLLNVWLLRRGSTTAYRGGEAKNLKEEFATYGLPASMFYIVGGLKIICGVLLLVGLWYQPVVLPAAAVVVVLMFGAVVMHNKVGDGVVKFIPATLMLAMSGAIWVIARL